MWLEPLLDEDPFVTDDVVTVMEGATRDLQKKIKQYYSDDNF